MGKYVKIYVKIRRYKVVKMGDKDYSSLYTIGFIEVALKVYKLKFKH